MPWFRKDEPDLPAELKEFTPEQIVAKIKEADQLRQDVASRDAALQTKDGELATARQELANATRQPERTEEETSFFADPQKHVSQIMAPTTAIAIHAGKIAAKMSAVQSMKREDAAIFRKYESEISKMVEGFNPAQQVMPESWVFALNQIKGQRFDEIAKAKSENSDFFAEVPSNQPQPVVQKPDQLSDEEQRICKRMNITPERYLAQKKAMTVVNA